MPVRRVVPALLAGVLLLFAVLIAGFVYGQQACPPPAWAFWRYTDGPDGAQNFACVAGQSSSLRARPPGGVATAPVMSP